LSTISRNCDWHIVGRSSHHEVEPVIPAREKNSDVQAITSARIS
jgi:hypothetical protein